MRTSLPAAAAAALLAWVLPLRAQTAPADPRRAEVIKLLDAVLADPSDTAARSRLKAAAGRAAASERGAAARERDALLDEARRARERRDEMNAARERRMDVWEEEFSLACSLAANPDTAAEAVSAYERLLGAFPVYSDNAEALAAADARIRGIFFKTVKKHHPYLAEGRGEADSRMLAALQFARVSEQQSLYGGVRNSGETEAQLKKAQKLRGLEAGLKLRHANLREALSLYERRQWEGAIKLLEKELDSDDDNDEALYYLELARTRAAAPGKR